MADLLGRHRYCVLATGRPRTCGAAKGDAVWFATVGGLRLRNLRATRWASLVVMEDEPHRTLTAEGPVALHEGDAFAAVFEALRTNSFERHGNAPDWAAVPRRASPAARLFVRVRLT